MPSEQTEVKLPGQKEGIPLWILIGGGVLILGFILIMRQGKQGATTGTESTGLLAAELDTRMNDLWQQLLSFLNSQMSGTSGDMGSVGTNPGPCLEGFRPDPANPHNCIPEGEVVPPPEYRGPPTPAPIPLPGYPCPDGYMPNPANPGNCIPVSPAPQYQSPPPVPGLPPPAPPYPGTSPGNINLPPQAPPAPNPILPVGGPGTPMPPQAPKFRRSALWD